VAATSAQAWERHVKSYNSKYQLMPKHYDKAYLSTYRGDVIFVDDSQEFPNQTEFLDGMVAFAVSTMRAYWRVSINAATALSD